MHSFRPIRFWFHRFSTHTHTLCLSSELLLRKHAELNSSRDNWCFWRSLIKSARPHTQAKHVIWPVKLSNVYWEERRPLSDKEASYFIFNFFFWEAQTQNLFTSTAKMLQKKQHCCLAIKSHHTKWRIRLQTLHSNNQLKTNKNVIDARLHRNTQKHHPSVLTLNHTSISISSYPGTAMTASSIYRAAPFRFPSRASTHTRPPSKRICYSQQTHRTNQLPKPASQPPAVRVFLAYARMTERDTHTYIHRSLRHFWVGESTMELKTPPCQRNTLWHTDHRSAEHRTGQRKSVWRNKSGCKTEGA